MEKGTGGERLIYSCVNLLNIVYLDISAISICTVNFLNNDLLYSRSQSLSLCTRDLAVCLMSGPIDSDICVIAYSSSG